MVPRRRKKGCTFIRKKPCVANAAVENRLEKKKKGMWENFPGFASPTKKEPEERHGKKKKTNFDLKRTKSGQPP